MKKRCPNWKCPPHSVQRQPTIPNLLVHVDGEGIAVVLGDVTGEVVAMVAAPVAVEAKAVRAEESPFVERANQVVVAVAAAREANRKGREFDA